MSAESVPDPVHDVAEVMAEHGMTWAEPRPKELGGRPTTDWSHLSTLTTKPKQWARVKTFSSSATASNYPAKFRKRPPPTLPAGTWEWRAVTDDPEPGKSALYARWMGPS